MFFSIQRTLRPSSRLRQAVDPSLTGRRGPEGVARGPKMSRPPRNMGSLRKGLLDQVNEEIEPEPERTTVRFQRSQSPRVLRMSGVLCPLHGSMPSLPIRSLSHSTCASSPQTHMLCPHAPTLTLCRFGTWVSGMICVRSSCRQVQRALNGSPNG